MRGKSGVSRATGKFRRSLATPQHDAEFAAVATSGFVTPCHVIYDRHVNIRSTERTRVKHPKGDRATRRLCRTSSKCGRRTSAPLHWSAGCSPLAARSGELTGRSIFDVLGSFLEQESGKLKRLNRNPLVVLQLRSEVLQPT